MSEEYDDSLDLESKLAEALQIADNEEEERKVVEEEEEEIVLPTLEEEKQKEMFICPKCKRNIDFYYESTYGWVKCPKCSKSIRYPSEFEKLGLATNFIIKRKEVIKPQKIEVDDDGKMDKRKRMMLEEMEEEEDDEDDDYYDDDNSYDRPIFRDERKEHWSVLKDILKDYSCKPRFIELMVKKAKRSSSRGPMHPTELYTNIMSLDSGITKGKAAKMITGDYEQVLDTMFDEKSERSDDRYESRRGYPRPPGREDYEPTYRKRTYSYEPKINEQKEKDSDVLSSRDIMQIIKEEFHQRDKRDKVDDLADYVKDLQRSILEKDRDKEGSKFEQLQEQMLQMQENFQEALIELAGNKESDKQSEIDFKKWQMEIEQKRESDRIQREQRRDSEHQNRESQDRFFQMMMGQQQSQDLKLREKEKVDLAREQQMLGLVMDTFNKERNDSDKKMRELTEARKHSDYQDDSMRLTSDAMDKLARIAETRKPVDALMQGLVKLSRPTPLPTQQAQLPPPKPVDKDKDEVLEIDETDEILSAFGDEDIVD